MRGRPAVFALVIAGWMAAALSSVHTLALSERQRVEGSAPQVQATPAPVSPTSPGVKAVLDQYCVVCHSERLKTAGIVLEGIDVANPAARADVWERVIVKLRAQSMPPAGRPRPDAATQGLIQRVPMNEQERTVTFPGRPPWLSRAALPGVFRIWQEKGTELSKGETG